MYVKGSRHIYETNTWKKNGKRQRKNQIDSYNRVGLVIYSYLAATQAVTIKLNLNDMADPAKHPVPLVTPYKMGNFNLSHRFLLTWRN